MALVALPACGDSGSGDDRSNEPLTPGGNGGGGSSVNDAEVRLSLTVDGTPFVGMYRPGGSSSLGGYFTVRFDDGDTNETVLELGFTDAVSSGTYPLVASEVELGSSEPRVLARIRYEDEARLEVAGEITLETFEVEDPAGPFSVIEGSFEGTVTTADGSTLEVTGDFYQESTCHANPGARALGC